MIKNINILQLKERPMTKTAVINQDFSWHLMVLALLSALVLLIPDLYAVTAQNSMVGNYICFIADNFEGNAGRGIATIGLSVLGTLALLGRVTWTQAIVIGVGCAVLFGAPGIAQTLGM